MCLSLNSGKIAYLFHPLQEIFLIILLQCLQRDAFFLWIQLLLMLHNLLGCKGETDHLGRIADNDCVGRNVASYHTSTAYIAASAYMSAAKQCHI